MKKETQEALRVYRDDLEREAPEAAPVLELLGKTGLALRRLEPARGERPAQNQAPRTWFLDCEPGQALRERFDLAPELLVVLIPARTAQARDIDAAEERLLRDHRLDRGVVLVITRDESARGALAQQARETQRIHLFFSFAECGNVRDPQRWLRDELLTHLGSSDLFAAGSPVYSWDFFGREAELEAIRKRLAGGQPVGLYGLRKIGKTSLLFRLRKRMIDESRPPSEAANDAPEVTLPIYLDTQKIGLFELNRAGFLRELVEAAYRAVGDLGLSPAALGLDAGLGTAKGRTRLDAEAISRAAVQTLELLVDWARQRPGRRRVVLFIDEYERLLEGRDFARQDGLQILTYLRGLLQSNVGVFGFLIAGRSRALAFTPSFAGQQNPLLNLLVDVPLAGLERGDFERLMSRVGKRLSLDLRHDALEAIWQETGGHPYLAREFGRLIDRDVPVEERKERAKPVHKETVSRLRASFRRQVEPTLQEIGETVEGLARGTLFTLSYAQKFPQDAGAALAELTGGVLDQLQRFGILGEQQGGWQVRIGCFADWVEANYDGRPRQAAQG
jgi:hypothetical protein